MVEQMAIILRFKITDISELYYLFVKDISIDKCILLLKCKVKMNSDE